MSLAATQLRLFIDSKQTLIREKRSTWGKLARKKVRREYIAEVGQRAFRRVADKGAKSYVKELRIQETWSKAFPTDDRNEVARELEREFRARYATGELDSLLPVKLRPRRRSRGNPIRKGYSRATVSDNISTLVREGKPRAQAVAIALDSARESYRERHPGRAVPGSLQAASPKKKTKKKTTKKKATRKKATRRKVTRKKATPKKATRKKTTRKKTTRKKTTRKKTARRKKTTRKKATTRRRKKATRRRAR